MPPLLRRPNDFSDGEYKTDGEGEEQNERDETPPFGATSLPYGELPNGAETGGARRKQERSRFRLVQVRFLSHDVLWMVIELHGQNQGVPRREPA